MAPGIKGAGFGRWRAGPGASQATPSQSASSCLSGKTDCGTRRLRSNIATCPPAAVPGESLPAAPVLKARWASSLQPSPSRCWTVRGHGRSSLPMATLLLPAPRPGRERVGPVCVGEDGVALRPSPSGASFRYTPATTECDDSCGLICTGRARRFRPTQRSMVHGRHRLAVAVIAGQLRRFD